MSRKSFWKAVKSRFSDQVIEDTPSHSQSLSQRGYRATQTPLRSDMDLYFEAKEDLWHPASNPNGKFPLNMAENNLCWNDLRTQIESKLRQQSIPDWVSNYTGIGGSDTFLEVLATFMSIHLARCTISPEHLAASAGATAVIELASWTLCDAGGVAVIPAPSYPVYTQDIHNKSKVERYNLHTHHNISELNQGIPLSINHLDNAKKEIESQGKRFELLLITHPDNPTGLIYSETQLRDISRWCIEHKIHLLVNELYGLSQIDTTHPDIALDYTGDLPFIPFMQIMEEEKSPYLHHAYGLSKDLGVSGFRIGVIYSRNTDFLDAYRNVNAPHMVSNIAQWIFEMILSDKSLMSSYIKTNQERLTRSYTSVVQGLKSCSIPYAPARGSLFVWLELSEFLRNNTMECEHNLWMTLYNETGLLLTPGDGFGHSKWGQFRLVHSFLSPGALDEAVRRLALFVKESRTAKRLF